MLNHSLTGSTMELDMTSLPGLEADSRHQRLQPDLEVAMRYRRHRLVLGREHQRASVQESEREQQVEPGQVQE